MVGTKISIFSSENIVLFLIFSIFSKYQPLLLLFTFLIHAYLTQTAQVRDLLDAGEILTQILGRNNVADDRHRRTAHAITLLDVRRAAPYKSLIVFVFVLKMAPFDRPYMPTNFYWSAIVPFEFRKLGSGFLFLFFYCNYGAVLFRLRDIATYWSKMAKCLYPTCV